jgi:L-aminopeptidase/D-esterase-like protein
VRTVLVVKRIFGVTIVGTILTLLVIWMLRSRKDAEASPATTATATTAAGTAVAAAATPPASDHAACEHLADLCSTSQQKVDVPDCERQLADARKMSGPANVDHSLQCVTDAKSCASATGCISGGVGMGALGEFMKGFGSALSH